MDIVALVALLLLSAFFSGSEAAFLSLERIRLLTLVEQGEKRAVRVAKMLECIGDFLGTILIGNTLVNVALASIATGMAISHFGPRGIPIATVTVTVILLIFGELIPKTVAAGRPKEFTYAVVYPLVGITLVFRPLVRVITAAVWPVHRLMGLRGSSMSPLVTEEELKMMFHVGKEEGVLEEHEKRMLRSVIEFEDTMVKEVMVPRLDMVALPEDASLDQIVQKAVSKGFSRIPVYRKNLDHIIGIAYVKDLLAFWESRQIVRLPDFIREAYFIPETKKIGRLLREFQVQKIHMAIVVDEFGAVAGLVTLEDLVEEIVGEIQDEYDEEEKILVQLPDGSKQIQGRLDLDDFNEMFRTRIPEGDYDTIGGFVISLFGRLPKMGEEITYEHLSFKATEVKEQRLMKIAVRERELAGNNDN